MALFGIGKKKAAPAPKSEPEVLWTKKFTQSGTFRGYRRVQLSTFKREGVSETLAYFKERNNDFKGRTIRLDHIMVPDIFTDGPAYMVEVYVDDMHIGTVFGTNEHRYPMLTEYEFDKVHIKVEDGTVYLFVHYPAEAPIKVSTRVE